MNSATVLTRIFTRGLQVGKGTCIVPSVYSNRFYQGEIHDSVREANIAYDKKLNMQYIRSIDDHSGQDSVFSVEKLLKKN
tara:strand:- start:964 stop:1203 length:240 start_codon:yes stop_codon:yes gene_type:complete